MPRRIRHHPIPGHLRASIAGYRILANGTIIDQIC
jgi:hypothetical protein